MPSVRKLSQEEVWTLENKGKGQRKLVEEQYDAILNDYQEGDYGEAELETDENRLTVRNRLRAAAQRRNLSLDFRRTKGNVLRFKVGAGGAAPTEKPAVAPTPAPAAAKGRGRKKKEA
jgi:hypothetical protein